MSFDTRSISVNGLLLLLTNDIYLLKVGWDESAAGERPNRVSIWEVEPVVTPFYICPPPFFRPKFPKQPGMPGNLNLQKFPRNHVVK